MGQSLPIQSASVPANVRFAPKATKMVRRGEGSNVPEADIRKAGRAKKKDRLAAVSPKSDQVF
jgi:hypothetical protein